MLGRTNTGGGGTPLNFKVVGNPQPETAKENTIWVNTDVKITGYDFNATQPETAEEGVVWIITGTSSTSSFNALKKNGITVYPISAKQYISGAWVDKTAKSYQNGAWVDWRYDLYITGDEWKTRGWAYSSSWHGAVSPTAKKNSDGSTTVSWSWSTSGYGHGGVWELVQNADLTNFNTVKIVCTASGSANSKGHTGIQLVAVSRGATYWGTDAVAKTTINDSSAITTYSLDVKSLSGNYDIAVGFSWDSGWLGAVTMKTVVYDVYIE